MPDARFTAPPFYRKSKAGSASQKHTMAPASAGRHQSNVSVPPIVHTNGKGERVLFRTRSVRTVVNTLGFQGIEQD